MFPFTCPPPLLPRIPSDVNDSHENARRCLPGGFIRLADKDCLTRVKPASPAALLINARRTDPVIIKQSAIISASCTRTCRHNRTVGVRSYLALISFHPCQLRCPFLPTFYYFHVVNMDDIVLDFFFLQEYNVSRRNYRFSMI